MLAAIPWDAGPLIRTTPMPPRPGGVAIATMESSVENIEPTDCEPADQLTTSQPATSASK
jgi:hypothetical protein